MESETECDTSDYFEMWVRDVEYICGETCLHGEVFDGDFGFGLDKYRRFEGDVLFVSDEVHTVQHAVISIMHVSRRGTMNTISEVEQIPAPPFLISTNLFLKGPFRIPVHVEPTVEALQILKNSEIQEFPVRAKRMIGLLRRAGKDYELTTFSEERLLAEKKWDLVLAEWDTKLGWARPL